MILSLHRLLAIINKEWKDSMKNPQILLMAGIPILMAILAKGRPQTAGEGMDIFTLPLMVAIVTVGAFAQALMISEEKEKNTLRALMLSPASPMEVLLGKSAMTAVFTAVVIVICTQITGIPDLHIGFLILFVLIMLIIFMAFGTIIGLISRTASETSIVGLPVLLIFIFGPMFGTGIDSAVIVKIVELLPSYQFMIGLSEHAHGGGFEGVKGSLLNLAIWAAAAIVLTLIIYRSKSFDK
ncbi:ABC transporter permease [Paenibacillus sp. NPDC057967]|uniref:ABC transporter permease n=1 Tax=Paenibacillus sp. NPDC057967 TaxID=3346293 RepID=UPI0036D8A71A